jgi:hypothetical protein
MGLIDTFRTALTQARDLVDNSHVKAAIDEELHNLEHLVQHGEQYVEAHISNWFTGAYTRVDNGAVQSPNGQLNEAPITPADGAADAGTNDTGPDASGADSGPAEASFATGGPIHSWPADPAQATPAEPGDAATNVDPGAGQPPAPTTPQPIQQ